MTSLNHNTQVSLLYYLVLWLVHLSTVCFPPHDGSSPRAVLYPVKSNNIENNALKTVNVQALGTA